MLEMYKGFVENYGVITIEDPYEQDDWDNWKAITADVQCQIVGDDQLVTNPTRIKKAIEQKASNALLLKVGLLVSYVSFVQWCWQQQQPKHEWWQPVQLCHRALHLLIIIILIIPCKPYLSASATAPHPLGRRKVERLFSLFSV
jgi:enolase